MLLLWLWATNPQVLQGCLAWSRPWLIHVMPWLAGPRLCLQQKSRYGQGNLNETSALFSSCIRKTHSCKGHKTGALRQVFVQSSIPNAPQNRSGFVDQGFYEAWTLGHTRTTYHVMWGVLYEAIHHSFQKLCVGLVDVQHVFFMYIDLHCILMTYCLRFA